MKFLFRVLTACTMSLLLACGDDAELGHDNIGSSVVSKLSDPAPGRLQDASEGPTDLALAGGQLDTHGEGGTVSTSDAGSRPTDLIRLKADVIMDATGFGQPMVAATIFVPHGWQSEGGVVWGSQYSCTNGYALNWMARSPDAQQAIAILPQQRWEWNSTGQPLQLGCQIAQIDSVRGYLNTILPELVPDARIVGFRPRSDIEQELKNMNAFSDNGFQRIQSQVQAAEIIIEFDLEGVAMRGILVAAAQFTHMRTGGGQFGVATDNLTGFALPAFGAYAPLAEFAPAVYEAIRKSFMSNPAWDAQIAQHNSTIGRINLQGAIDRANIHNKAMQDIAKIRNDAWAAQQKRADVRAREFVEYIRDVETYRDADAPGGQVELDSFYQHAWRLNDGSYVLTNDVSFQPGRDLGVDGRQLSVQP